MVGISEYANTTSIHQNLSLVPAYGDSGLPQACSGSFQKTAQADRLWLVGFAQNSCHSIRHTSKPGRLNKGTTLGRALKDRQAIQIYRQSFCF